MPEERAPGPRLELDPPPGPERPLEAPRKPRPPPAGRLERGRSDELLGEERSVERSEEPVWLPLGPELWEPAESPDFQERVSMDMRSFMPAVLVSTGLLRSSFSRFLSASRQSNLILSSRSILRASERSCGMTKVVATPFAPARPVRPMRWTKSSEALGMS